MSESQFPLHANGIITVAGTIRLSENTNIDVLAAQFGVSKNDAVRALLRFAMADPQALTNWMIESPDIWRRY